MRASDGRIDLLCVRLGATKSRNRISQGSFAAALNVQLSVLKDLGAGCGCDLETGHSITDRAFGHLPFFVCECANVQVPYKTTYNLMDSRSRSQSAGSCFFSSFYYY